MPLKFSLMLLAAWLTCYSARSLQAGSIVDFEDVDLAGQQYQFSPTLNGISIQSNSPWGATHAVSRKQTLTDIQTYWANGDDTVVSTGGANGSQQWFAAYNFSPGDVIFVAPAATTIASVSINNTALVDHTVRNGLFQARAFQPNDFLRVRFLGMNPANQPSGLFTQWIDLASYGTSLYVLSQWTTVDLTPLDTNRIAMEIQGSDMHPQFGLNTPAYLAVDNLRLSNIPEPSSLSLLLVACGLGLTRGNRSRQR